MHLKVIETIKSDASMTIIVTMHKAKNQQLGRNKLISGFLGRPRLDYFQDNIDVLCLDSCTTSGCLFFL